MRGVMFLVKLVSVTHLKQSKLLLVSFYLEFGFACSQQGCSILDGSLVLLSL